MENGTKPTLFLADDHLMVTDGLTKLLEDQFAIVGSAANGFVALGEVKRLKPDLVLLEIALTGITGIELTRSLSKSLPNPRVLILSQHRQRGYVQEAFRAGAKGYLLKESTSAELRKALSELMAGHYYVTPLVTKDISPCLIDPTANPGELFSVELTKRQQEVLKWVATGKPVKEIAYILEISGKTVEYHKAKIMDLLNLRKTAQLTRYAIENGIV